MDYGRVVMADEPLYAVFADYRIKIYEREIKIGDSSQDRLEHGHEVELIGKYDLGAAISKYYHNVHRFATMSKISRWLHHICLRVTGI